ncbi:MAG: DUF996 domain-containing protein [Candidatus Bathyarchaeota archaeon]|nr:DUF996 domain-containing protein [Candidatus Bathyarchaeota archaeon]
MSLETGRKLGLISTLLLIILPVISIISIVGFVSSILSSAIGLGGSSLPSDIFAASAGLGILTGLLGILQIVALILFVIAMYLLSRYYNERGIFTNIIYAVILMAITVGIVIVTEFLLLVPYASTISTTSPPTEILGGFLTYLIVILVVAVVVIIVSAVLIMRALNKLGEKSEVDSFKTAGTLFLIGILLTILVVGVFIVWIAMIFAFMGFYRLKPLPPPTATTTYQAPPPIVHTTVCPQCGAINTPEAVYCKNCGNHL